MDEDEQLQNGPPDTDEQQKNESGSGGPGLRDLKNASDDFSRIAKGGAKPPLPGAAGAGTSAAGSTAGATTASAGGTAAATSAGAATTGATATTGTGVAASGATTAAAGATASAPLWPWLLLGAIVLLILLLIIFFIVGLISDGQLSPTDSPVSISKTGPSQVANGATITYSFNVTYSGTAEDITVRDPLPADTEYVSSMPTAKTLDSGGNPTTDPALVKAVEWSLKEIQGTSGSSTFSEQGLSLTIRPLSPDIYVMNQATASVTGGSGNPNITPGPSGIIPPNEDDCGGYYTSFINRNPLNKNFGDPGCTMLANSKPEDKDKLYALFQQLDPTYADYWFFTIVPCESSYIPNNYANYWDELHDQFPNLDPDGVWGLLQMGSDLDGDGSGKNGPLDRGDVNWEKQVSNAVDYSRWITTQGGGQWAYWQCANGTHP